ncbi:hypothetical protein AB1Y20_017702 [Prymnesium parvum]|uniref:J domain-containing protein n=1 Tax=Prymnesium parvum TaxID=97485 RepID=A0AB34JPP0_PRYPA
MASEWHETAHGFYAALGLTFDAPHEEVKRAYRRESLKHHPDRHRGEAVHDAKQRFQLVNSAFECLSDPARRKEYDGIFRMRCVLEQGRITERTLLERPLDCVYIFAVVHHKGIGLREENVLLLNLPAALEGAALERVRHGEVVDSRPLATVRAAEVEPGSATVKLLLRDPSRASGEAGRSSTLQLSARSASDALSIATLLRALISFSLTGEPALRFRTDDADMPPPARMAGWLTVRTGQKFGGTSRPFALLGRSKLLMFSDRTCTTLRQLLTLEASALRVSHTVGEKELELQLGSFKLSLATDSAFVTEQWAQAITEASMTKGLFLDPSEQPPPSELRRSSSTAQATPSNDPFEYQAACALPRSRPPPPPPPAKKGSVAREVEVGDLLGDLSTPSKRQEDDDLKEDLQELYSAPTTEVDTTLGERSAAVDAAAASPAAPCEREPSPHPSASAAPHASNMSPFMAAVHEAVLKDAAAKAPPPPPPPPPPEPPPFIDWTDAPPAPPAAGIGERRPPPTASTLLDELLPSSLPSAGLEPPPLVASAPAAVCGRTLEDELLREFVPPAVRAAPARHLLLMKPQRDAKLGLQLRCVGSSVHVHDVAAGSLAAQAGLQRGDKLVKIGGLAVHSNEQAAQWLSQAVGAIAISVESAAPSTDAARPEGVEGTSTAGRVGEGGGGGGAAAVEHEPAGEVTAPTIPFVESTGPDSIVVEWQLPAWADASAVARYELQWRLASEDCWYSSASSRDLETKRVVLRKLLPGQAYCVRVRAVGSRGNTSDFSESLVPVATAPPPPEAFPVLENVVHLFFEPVPTAAKYELQWRAYSAGQHPSEGWEGNEASSRLRGVTVKKRNLEVGKRFEFRVRAVSAEGLPTPFSAPSLPVLVGDPEAHFDLLDRERKAAEAAEAAELSGRGRNSSCGNGAAGAVDVARTRASSGDGNGCNSTRDSSASSAMLEQLIGLGLSTEDAILALRETGGANVAAAADWYFSQHQADFEKARRARASDDVERLLDDFL